MKTVFRYSRFTTNNGPSTTDSVKKALSSGPFEYFKSKNYTVRFRKNGKFFTLFIPDLSLVAEDEKLEKAYEKLEQEKEKFFRCMIESGFANCIPEPERVDTANKPRSGLKHFFVKLSIIVTLIILLGGFSYKLAISEIKEITKSLSRLTIDIKDDLRGVDERITGAMVRSGFRMIEKLNGINQSYVWLDKHPDNCLRKTFLFIAD